MPITSSSLKCKAIINWGTLAVSWLLLILSKSAMVEERDEKDKWRAHLKLRNMSFPRILDLACKDSNALCALLGSADGHSWEWVISPVSSLLDFCWRLLNCTGCKTHPPLLEFPPLNRHLYIILNLHVSPCRFHHAKRCIYARGVYVVTKICDYIVIICTPFWICHLFHMYTVL